MLSPKSIVQVHIKCNTLIVEREVSIPETTESVIAMSSSLSMPTSMGHNAGTNEPTTMDWGWYVMRSMQKKKTNQKLGESLKGKKARRGQTPRDSSGRMAQKDHNLEK